MYWKKVLQSTLIAFLIITNFSYQLGALPSLATEVEDYEEELEQKEREKQAKEAILAQTRADLDAINQSGASIDAKIAMLEEKINNLSNQIAQKEQEIVNREAELSEKEASMELKQEAIKNVSATLYKNSKVGVLEAILSSGFSGEFVRGLNYRKYVLDAQSDIIKALTQEYVQIQVERDILESQKGILAQQKSALDQSKIDMEAERARLNEEYWAKINQQNQLSGEISQLNADISSLQQAIIYARSGSEYIKESSVPSSGDYNATLAGFRANAPSGYFGVFSIGAFTHRNGMSQWGALARANSGQTAEQIISYYYPGGTINYSYPEMQNISVIGYGTMSFEDQYLTGIAEVPESWSFEVLKVQAIAARTYAIRYTNNGASSICTNEACQYFAGPSARSGAWKQAVEATRGQVLVDGGGSPMLTQYAAVHGGWINGIGWDTTDGTNSGDWYARAWESISGISWFYKAWYRQGYSDSSWDCGRGGPWMSEEEMADILNAWMVMKGVDLKVSPDISRITPVDYNACWGGSTNPYSMAELRDLINTPVTTISGTPVVINDTSGNSQNVVFNTNRGQMVLPASEFKNTFNTRAPGFLGIQQFGFSFYNIERN